MSLNEEKQEISKDELDEATEHDVVLMLKAVYDRANWKTIGRNSYPSDVFSHKVKATAYETSIPRFIDKLCYNLGVQSVTVDVEVLKRLEKQCSLVLKCLAKETVYYVILVEEEVKKWKR